MSPMENGPFTNAHLSEMRQINAEQLALGIDFGTSGARAIAIDQTGQIRAERSRTFDQSSPHQRAHLWQAALMELLLDLPLAIRQQVGAIAINGTSSTVLLCDRQGQPVVAPRMYNEAVDVEVVKELDAIAPAHHPVLSTTSSLAKLFHWLCQMDTDKEGVPLNMVNHGPLYFLHQADWLSFLLHGQLGISDYHNSLKLGYDVGALAYPAWFSAVWSRCKEGRGGMPVILPRVVEPGQGVGLVSGAIADPLGFRKNCVVCAGTTDSIAAFLASGVQLPGEAVTSLGSTLVLKLLSRTRVDDAAYGVYSHRLGHLWLVGGASNTGGAVLRQFFTDEELKRLSDRIAWQQPSPLRYYPLLKPGERFPLNDPHLVPCLEPRPKDSGEFLYGLLDSIARIEAQGYALLQDLGATPLNRLYTAGGGAKNDVWMRIRSRHLGLDVERSPQAEAAYGSATLALQGRCAPQGMN